MKLPNNPTWASRCWRRASPCGPRCAPRARCWASIRLYVANEGKLIAIVGRDEADRVLDVMRQQRYGEDAVIVGEVQAESPGRVLLKTAIGSHRIVDVLLGEMLPRIC